MNFELYTGKYVPAVKGEVKVIMVVMRESEIWEPPKINIPETFLSTEFLMAQSDVTEIPYSSLVKNHILQKVIEMTMAQE